MGTTRNGLLRSVSGRVGPVVVAESVAVSIVRILPKLSTKKPKQSQLSQRGIFKIGMEFVTQNQDVMRIGYQSSKGLVKPLNAAASHTIKNAVVGSYPNFEIDYSKVRTSSESGGMQGVAEAKMIAVENGKVTVTWTPDLGGFTPAQQLLRNQDEAVLLLFNETTGYSLPSIGEAIRLSGTLTARIPMADAGNKVHGWFFFVTAAGKVNKSQYLGTAISIE